MERCYQCPLCPMARPTIEKLVVHMTCRHPDTITHGVPPRGVSAVQHSLGERVWYCACGVYGGPISIEEHLRLLVNKGNAEVHFMTAILSR